MFKVEFTTDDIDYNLTLQQILKDKQGGLYHENENGGYVLVMPHNDNTQYHGYYISKNGDFEPLVIEDWSYYSFTKLDRTIKISII